MIPSTGTTRGLPPGTGSRTRPRAFLLPLGMLLLMGVSLWHLEADLRGMGMERHTDWVGSTPVTLYERQSPTPTETPDRPVIVVGHGFAGSQRLMEPVALRLAAHGYLVITYDQIGHGRHPEPMRGKLGSQDGAARQLVDQSHEVIAYARAQPGVRGRVALVGHSMATNILARTAQEDPELSALAAISMFAPTVDAKTPRNLLVIGGAFEGRLLAEGRRVVGLSADLPPEAVEPGVTYGNPAAGTARRLVVAPGVEHVGVLYSATTLTETAQWMDDVFGSSRPGGGDPDATRARGRGLWIALFLMAVLVLARSAAQWLPQIRETAPAEPSPRPGQWRLLAIRSGIPALATPLILAPLPTQFLPVIVADYVAIHFGVYGFLSLLLLWITRGRPSLREALGRTGDPSPQTVRRTVFATAGFILFFLVLVALPLDRFFTAFTPGPGRWVLVLALLAGTLPFFVSDEWITRRMARRDTPQGGLSPWTYATSKVIFLFSLGLAVLLDFEGLFFLLIIVPIVMLFFLVHGFLSHWTVARTGSPLVAGLGNAFAFAWALGVTFPLYAGP